MNDHKIDSHSRIFQAQQNHGLAHDFDYEFGAVSPESNTMEIWVQQQKTLDNYHHHQQQQSLSHSQLQSLVNQATTNNKASSTIINRFETPSLAFYSTERCMGFHNFNANNKHTNNTSLSTQFSASSSTEKFSINDSSTDATFMTRPDIGVLFLVSLLNFFFLL